MSRALHGVAAVVAAMNLAHPGHRYRTPHHPPRPAHHGPRHCPTWHDYPVASWPEGCPSIFPPPVRPTP
jgi:hypothetical protein